MGEGSICGDHKYVDKVNIQYPAYFSSRNKFAGDTAAVAEHDKIKENKTFSCGIFHPDGFDDLGGPACSEYDKHDTFKNLCGFHFLTPFCFMVLNGI